MKKEKMTNSLDPYCKLAVKIRFSNASFSQSLTEMPKKLVQRTKCEHIDS